MFNWCIFEQIRGWKKWEQETSTHNYEFSNGISLHGSKALVLKSEWASYPILGKIWIYWSEMLTNFILLNRSLKIPTYSRNIICQSAYQFLDADSILLLCCKRLFLVPSWFLSIILLLFSKAEEVHMLWKMLRYWTEIEKKAQEWNNNKERKSSVYLD